VKSETSCFKKRNQYRHLGCQTQFQEEATPGDIIDVKITLTSRIKMLKRVFMKEIQYVKTFNKNFDDKKLFKPKKKILK